MILPAVIVLGLSMLRVDVKQSMTLSIVCAVILCVVFQHRSAAEIIRIMLTGYRAGDPVAAQMINGGGPVSYTHLKDLQRCTGMQESTDASESRQASGRLY